MDAFWTSWRVLTAAFLLSPASSRKGWGTARQDNFRGGIVTILLVFLLGAALLGWHASHERCLRLEEGNAFLAGELLASIAENERQRKPSPSPAHWGGTVFDKLWADIQAAPPLHVAPDMELVDDDMPEAS